MELLAEPQPTLTWVCPECGHGSPEPRDQQAHLDAHRQLRQFFREWDAAAAEHRSRRPLVLGCVALLAALAVAVFMLLRVSGGGDVAPSARPGVPVPGAGVPQAPAPGPVPSESPPVASNQARPDQPADGGANGRTTSAPAAGGASSVQASATAGILPPRAATSTAATSAPPVATIPASAPSTRSGLAVRGCLIVVCLELGT